MTVEEARAHIGGRVLRRVRDELQTGVIVSAGTEYVCVRYVGSVAPRATRPAELSLVGSTVTS